MFSGYGNRCACSGSGHGRSEQLAAYNRTANAWRYSPLDQINKDNVSKLSVAWIAHGGDITMGIQETPIVIDGVIYSITSGNRVAALDGKTGQQIWSL